MKKLILILILCSFSFGNIPQETSYGAFVNLNGGTLGFALRQPAGNEAIDVYLDWFLFNSYLGLSAQYMYMKDDIFPVKQGKLIVQYGPGAGVWINGDAMNISFVPAAGLDYYFDQAQWDMFFNLNLAMGVTIYDADSWERRNGQATSQVNIIPNPGAQLGFRYRF